jgi:hypothetical protein
VIFGLKINQLETLTDSQAFVMEEEKPILSIALNLPLKG